MYGVVVAACETYGLHSTRLADLGRKDSLGNRLRWNDASLAKEPKHKDQECDAFKTVPHKKTAKRSADQEMLSHLVHICEPCLLLQAAESQATLLADSQQ
jgi:hypothetical protein